MIFTLVGVAARPSSAQGVEMSTFKEGELYKRGKINTDWKLRTFILDSKMISYFKGGVS